MEQSTVISIVCNHFALYQMHRCAYNDFNQVISFHKGDLLIQAHRQCREITNTETGSKTTLEQTVIRFWPWLSCIWSQNNTWHYRTTLHLYYCAVQIVPQKNPYTLVVCRRKFDKKNKIKKNRCIMKLPYCHYTFVLWTRLLLPFPQKTL